MTRFLPLRVVPRSFAAVSLVTVALLAGCSSDDDAGPAALPSSTPPPATATAPRTATPTAPATATATPVATATATAVATTTATATPTRTPTHFDPFTCCGDGDHVAAMGEECDDGNQVGGDGCAANCTLERMATLSLQGEATVQTGLFALTLPLSSEQTVRIGAPMLANASPECADRLAFAGAEIPVTQRLEDVSYEPAAVPGLACACVRPVVVARCGAPLVRPAGTSCDVGDDCTGDASVCGAASDCWPAHGDGNVSSGIIGCGGLDDVDYDIVADDQTRMLSCVRHGGPAPAGSAFLFTSSAIGTIQDSGTCSIDESDPRKGPDGIPCNDDDPAESRGLPMTTALTTGTADGAVVGGPVVIQEGRNCGALPCITSATGRPFDCEALLADPPSAGDFRLCSAFAALDQPSTGDIVVPLCIEER